MSYAEHKQGKRVDVPYSTRDAKIVEYKYTTESSGIAWKQRLWLKICWPMIYVLNIECLHFILNKIQGTETKVE